MAGKGSKARPLSVSREKFESNWEAIFGKKTTEEFAINVHGSHARNPEENAKKSLDTPAET